MRTNHFMDEARSVGDELGISVSGMKSRVQRGRRQLRQLLTERVGVPVYVENDAYYMTAYVIYAIEQAIAGLTGAPDRERPGAEPLERVASS